MDGFEFVLRHILKKNCNVQNYSHTESQDYYFLQSLRQLKSAEVHIVMSTDKKYTDNYPLLGWKAGYINVGVMDRCMSVSAYFNYGICVDMFAPEDDIFLHQTWTIFVAQDDGTSMATLHFTKLIGGQ